ncbi:hypothetical protein D3C71_78710 [compost metagenome]
MNQAEEISQTVQLMVQSMQEFAERVHRIAEKTRDLADEVRERRLHAEQAVAVHRSYTQSPRRFRGVARSFYGVEPIRRPPRLRVRVGGKFITVGYAG